METCRTTRVMTNIQRWTAFFLVWRSRLDSSFSRGEAKKLFSGSTLFFSNAGLVWYKGKGRKIHHKDLSNTVLNTSCKIKQTLPVLCSPPTCKPWLNLSPAAIQRCVKILLSHKTMQWNSSRFSFPICNSLLCSLGKIFCLACS